MSKVNIDSVATNKKEKKEDKEETEEEEQITVNEKEEVSKLVVTPKGGASKKAKMKEKKIVKADRPKNVARDYSGVMEQKGSEPAVNENKNEPGRDLTAAAEFTRVAEESRAETESKPDPLSLIEQARANSPSNAQDTDSSTVKFNLHYSLKQYLAEKSSFPIDFLQYTYHVAPDGTVIYQQLNDIYKGKAFQTKFEFWNEREMHVAKLVMAKLQIRMKMKITQINKDGGFTHWLDDQYVKVSKEELSSKLSLANNTDNAWSMVWKSFWNTEALEINSSGRIGNGAVMTKRTMRTFYNQDLWRPEPPTYLLDCFYASQDVYSRYKEFNLATNQWTMKYMSSNVVSEKNVCFDYQPSDLDVSHIFSIVSFKVPNFRNNMFLRAKSICESLVLIKTEASRVNSKELTDALNLVLTNVTNANSIPSNVFSAQANDIFSTLMAGCVMDNIFRLTYDINPRAARDLTKWTSIVCYLIYTPSPLLDPATVQSMKEYLFSTFLSSWKIGPVVRGPGGAGLYGKYGHFDPTRNSLLQRYALETAAPLASTGFPISTYWANWETLVQQVAGGAIKEFFEYDFGPKGNDQFNKKILFEGNFYNRYVVVLNFLRCINEFAFVKGTLTTGQNNIVGGLALVIQNQEDAYYEYCKFLTEAVDEVIKLGLWRFNSNEQKQSLDISYDKFLSMTVKLHMFSADFVNTWYRTVAWSNAVKVESGIAMNLILIYMQNTNYYANTRRHTGVFPSRGEVYDFIKPFLECYKSLFTTDVAQEIMRTFPQTANVEDPTVDIDILNGDVLGLRQLIPYCRDYIKYYEEESGYIDEIGFLALTTISSGEAMSYRCYASDVKIASKILKRKDVVRDSHLTPHKIKSDDAEYPSFRVVLKFNTDNLYMGQDYAKIYEQLQLGNSTIDIPLVCRWAANSGYYKDLIIMRPPIAMPFYSQNFGPIRISELINENDVITYFNNSISDVIFTGSEEFDKILISVSAT
jgi:hypothetical protein